MTTETHPTSDVEERRAAPSCRHHWIIEPPEGPTSYGYCRNCFKIQEFQNFLGEALWKGDGARATGFGMSLPHRQGIPNEVD